MPRTFGFHLNEHCDSAIAARLRRHGIDATTTPEVGPIGATGEPQLAHAPLGSGRMISTKRRDYLRPDAPGTPHAGLASRHQQSRSIGEIVDGLVLIREVYDPEEVAGRVGSIGTARRTHRIGIASSCSSGRPPVRRPGRLDGRTCLIVGGTGGIGLASARRFLEEGARVVVAGPSPELGRAAMARLAPLGPVWDCAVDLAAGEPEVARLFSSALDALGGRLDVLLHVAGISGRKFGDGPLHECTDAGWDRVMDVNASGVFLTNRAAVRLMLRQPIDASGLRGTVVNVGSVLDRAPAPEHFGTIAYAASKGAVRSLTRAAAAMYAPERIRFNLLAPGLIATPMAARAVNDPAIRPYVAARQPIAGGPGSAEDVAEAALYLCEPASRFVAGAELVIDGGWCVSEGGRPQTIPIEADS